MSEMTDVCVEMSLDDFISDEEINRILDDPELMNVLRLGLEEVQCE